MEASADSLCTGCAIRSTVLKEVVVDPFDSNKLFTGTSTWSAFYR